MPWAIMSVAGCVVCHAVAVARCHGWDDSMLLLWAGGILATYYV